MGITSIKIPKWGRGKKLEPLLFGGFVVLWLGTFNALQLILEEGILIMSHWPS